jgi:hypothetical protein
VLIPKAVFNPARVVTLSAPITAAYYKPIIAPVTINTIPHAPNKTLRVTFMFIKYFDNIEF